MYSRIVSRFELVYRTEKHIHLCETVGFARHSRMPSFVAAKMRAVHDLLSCASWLVEHCQAGKRSTFHTPSVLISRVKEVSDAAFTCLSEVS